MYAIIRTHKHKSIGSVARSAAHTFREVPTPNAITSELSRNRSMGCKSTESLLSSLKFRLPVSRRRDAVVCIEYLITASPEAFECHGGSLNEMGSGYFRDALRWLCERHGEGNVISAVVHLDESTPHLVAYVVPMTKDGRLSARDFLGGPKIMRALQDSFYEACGKPYGLVRGMKGSKAHHSKIARFYGVLSAAEYAPKLTAVDYAAKAMGYETKAWQEANSAARSQTSKLAANDSERKAFQAKVRVLEEAERRASEAARAARYSAKDLERRERSIEKREQALTRLKQELHLPHAYAVRKDKSYEVPPHLEEDLTLQKRPKNRGLGSPNCAPG